MKQSELIEHFDGLKKINVTIPMQRNYNKYNISAKTITKTFGDKIGHLLYFLP